MSLVSQKQKRVSFYPKVFIYNFVDDDYDRSIHPMASLTRADIDFIISLRILMRNGEFISDNKKVPAIPLPPREDHFQKFLKVWRSRGRENIE